MSDAWSEQYRWTDDGKTRAPADQKKCCGLTMKEVIVSGYPHYYCTHCGGYQRKTSNVSPWEEETTPMGQVEMGCGICGLTVSELSTIDPLTGDSVVRGLHKSLATPCEQCEGDYEEYETCDYCAGQGSQDCEYCLGHGTYECSECFGSEKIECGECQGEGVDEDMEECSSCQGYGEVECPQCEGEGSISCDECRGNGEFDCDECEGSGAINCGSCEDGMQDYVGLEEWCEYWESSLINPTESESNLYPWNGGRRFDIEWSDHCLAFGNPVDDLGLEVQKVGANKGVWAYKSSNSREASKASNAWEEETEDTDQMIMPVATCSECLGPAELFVNYSDFSKDSGSAVTKCLNGHTLLYRFMETGNIEGKEVWPLTERDVWGESLDELAEKYINSAENQTADYEIADGINLFIALNKTANAWTEERNPDQLRLVGCPNCGSDELMAHFEDGAIFAGCADCGEYFNYAEEYDQWSGKREPGYPTVVEDTLTNGGIYQGPTESTSFESEILSLVSGRDNEFFNEEAADQLYEWARLTNTLPELKDAAQTVSEEAATEIDNWSIEGIHFDPTYISAPMIEDMEDEEFLETFGEDKTREEAMNESNEAYQWYWDENANNHGAFKAAQHILDYFKEPTF